MSLKTLAKPEPLTKQAYQFANTFLHVAYVQIAAMELRDTLAKPWIKRAGYVALAVPADWAWHSGRVYECGHFFEFQNLE